MILETRRLNIYLSSNEQMEHLIAEQTSPELQEAYTQMLKDCLAHPNQREWYAIWNIELNDGSNAAIGYMSFRGLSKDGVLEITAGMRDRDI